MENLERLNIAVVSIVGRISLDDGGYDQLYSALSKHQGNWPRRNISKLGLYEVDGVRHHLSLDIETDRRTNPDIAIFTLEAPSFSRNERLRSSTRQRQLQQFSEIQAILSDLESSNVDGRLHSHILWSFPPDAKRPIINLPLMTVQSPGIPFSEITGIRLNRVTGEGTATVTMDLRSDRSLIVTLVLPPVQTRFSEKMLDFSVQRGTQIVDDFVFDVEDSVESREELL